MSEISIELFGNIEDAPDDKMVVRILGHRVGTSDGWFYLGGHSILMPEFKMEPGLHKFAPDVTSVAEHTGLLIDYYAGLIALVPHAPKGSMHAMELKPIWSAQITVTSANYKARKSHED